jgi:DNA repair protein RadC
MNNLKRIATFKDFVGELTVTYKRTELPRTTIKSSRDCYEYFKPYFEECMDDHEEFKVLHLSQSNGVVNVDHHSVGGVTGTIADVHTILRNAILIKTKAIIICHNHPSGNLKPSQSDIQLSRQVKDGCKILGLSLLDSLIVTREGYYSFADEGLL